MIAHGPSPTLHRGDLPAGVVWGPSIAIDTETMGLNPHRDRLCLVQVAATSGECHLVQLPKESWSNSGNAYHVAPNLQALLTDPGIEKIFHFARFDVAMIYHWLGVVCRPVYCTKVASKLVRTYTDRHGLRDLCRELLNIEISKEQQSSDWGRHELTVEQCRYAANDVLYLHRIREILDVMLEREGRTGLASACFDFLPARSILDVDGWPDVDILAY